MSVQSTVTVQSGGQPLAGVPVFVDGTNQGSTNASGVVVVTLPTGSTNNTISAKATGYTLSTVNNVAAGQSITISLSPNTVPASEPFTLTITPDAAAVGSPITFSNGGSPVTSNYVSGGLTVSLTPGPQTVTGSVPGYNAISVSFNSSTSNIGSIQLTATTDSGMAIANVAKAASPTPSASSVLPTITPEQPPEFVAPNTGQGTYFTMTQARMYIGGLFIDELNALQFALQDNKIPIYGYASRFYDALGQGKSLVQGQFTINFVSEGYLYRALQNYQTMQIQGSTIPAGGTQAQQQAQAQLTSLVNALQNPDPSWTPSMIAQAKAQIQSYAASLGPAAVTAAKQGQNAAIASQDSSVLGLPGTDYANAIYLDIPFDIVVQYSGAGRVITRRLEQCVLISNESIMDHSGTPILDSYGFIARRLR